MFVFGGIDLIHCRNFLGLTVQSINYSMRFNTSGFNKANTGQITAGIYRIMKSNEADMGKLSGSTQSIVKCEALR